MCVSFHPTHYNTVFADVDIGPDLRCVDNAVFFDEDVVSDVQREKCNSKWIKKERKGKEAWR